MAFPTYKSLGELRYELAVRLGFGGVGSASDLQKPILNSFLARGQEFIASMFDLRNIKKFSEFNTAQAQSEYDYPSDMDHLLQAWIKTGGDWIPLTEGITGGMDGLDLNSWPTRYDIRQGTTSQPQIQLWPIPDAIYPIKFEYIMRVGQFKNDNDKATFPDGLIFLHALTNAKAHYRQPDAQSIAAQLNTMVGTVRSRQHGNKKYYKRLYRGDMQIALGGISKNTFEYIETLLSF